MKLILATQNLHKIREFREMFAHKKEMDLLSLLNFPQYEPPEEKGKTFEENAILKAIHAAKNLNQWVLADDSGLVVPILCGEPGVRSRRYAHENAQDSDNRKKLLEKLEGKTDLERAAYFECVLALAGPEGLKKTVSGKVEGLILESERGRGGFGYDALFIKHDYDKTFAELDESTKNRISHRRKALDRILPYIESLIQKG
jgi:XTP/dITP diphosphohydrolase